MGRKNRIFKGNLKASQILAVLMLIVMIIRPIMEVSAKPGEITTENPSIITKAYTENFKHGMSVIDAYGAYSNKKFYICKTVISSYEEADVIDCVLNVAPNVIINSYKTNHFYGKFYHQPIG